MIKVQTHEVLGNWLSEKLSELDGRERHTILFELTFPALPPIGSTVIMNKERFKVESYEFEESRSIIMFISYLSKEK